MKAIPILSIYLYYVVICFSFCVEVLAGNLSKQIDAEIKCEDSRVETANLGNIRDQGEIGWCYAYTLADFASFYLNMRVSANDIAIKYNHSLKDEPKQILESFYESIKIKEGGNLLFAFELMNSSSEAGFCLESRYWKDVLINPDEDLNALTMRMYGNLAKQVHSDALAGSLQGSFENSQKELSTISRAMKKLRNNMSSNYNQVWNDMTELACRRKRKKIKGIIRGINTDTEKDMVLGMVQLRKQLKKGEIVSISYNAKDISEIKFRDEVLAVATFIGNRILPLNVDSVYNKVTSRPHTSNIVEMKLDKKSRQCMYLLRNTWGTDCKSYAREPQNCDKWGNLWVEETTLLKILYGISYLEHK